MMKNRDFTKADKQNASTASTAERGAARAALIAGAVLLGTVPVTAASVSTTEGEEIAQEVAAGSETEPQVVAQIGESSFDRIGTDSDLREDLEAARSDEPLLERLQQPESEALEGVPLSEYIARNPQLDRASALRSGPLSQEQLNEYKRQARLLAETDPKASKEALEYYRQLEFELHQDYWVKTGNPDVPPTGNVLPAAAVIIDSAADAATDE